MRHLALLLTALGLACSKGQATDPPPGPICTREAKLCPDGSAVGRRGPDCEFDPCPGADPCADLELPACPPACTTDARCDQPCAQEGEACGAEDGSMTCEDGAWRCTAPAPAGPGCHKVCR